MGPLDKQGITANANRFAAKRWAREQLEACWIGNTYLVYWQNDMI